MAKTQQTYNRSIGATQGGFQPTGIQVEAGDTITFSNATGSMQPWGGGPIYTPAGDPSLLWNLSLVPTETFCKLVGNIIDYDGNTQPFGIGNGASVVANISGQILIGINDGVSWADNQGPGYSVQISLPQESFLLIPPVQPLGVNPVNLFSLVRDYAEHQAQQALLGVDYTVNPDTPTFDTGSYTDPVSRTGGKFLERRVTSMTPGIIINCFREQVTVGTNNANPLFPGEDRGITTEVLTWYPYTSPNPDTYYVIQYTHVFPTFGAWSGGRNFPSIQTQINNGSILSTRQNEYANLPINQRNNNVAFGPLISAGTELGGYAMIGLSSVGPHLHISIAKFDASTGTLPSIVNGRPQFGNPSDFNTWLANPFGTTQFDPEIFVPGAVYG